MASLPHTNPRLLAQASHIPWAMSYLRFDYGLPPSRTNVLLHLLSALCPDVVQIIRGKTCFVHWGHNNICGKCSKNAAAASSQLWCRRTMKPDMHIWLVEDAAIYLKVPYYTVFHQFHTAVRGPTTLYSICIAPNTSVVLNSSCLKVALLSSVHSTLFLCLHL